MRIDSKLRMLVFIVTISFPAFLLAESPAEAEAAVESALADYRAAWLEGSEKKVMDAVSEDVQLFVPGTDVGRLNGKEAVREFWFPNTDRSYPIRGYEVSGQETYVQGDLAIVTGNSTLDWDTVDAGKVVDQKTSRSEYMTVLRKEDGKWRIFRQMYQMRE